MLARWLKDEAGFEYIGDRSFGSDFSHRLSMNRLKKVSVSEMFESSLKLRLLQTEIIFCKLIIKMLSFG